MRKNTSVKINFIMNFILTISNFIFPLITFPYVSRVLGAEGLGSVTFASSIVAYFSMFALLGVPVYGIRACAKVREDAKELSKTVIEVFLLNLLFTVIAQLALMVSVFTVNKLSSEVSLYLMLSSTLVFNLLGVDWLYRGLEEYSYITIRSLVFKIISIALLFLLVRGENDYLEYAFITIVASVGSNFFNFIYLRKVFSWEKVAFNHLEFKKHMGPIISFFMITVSTTIYLNMDTTLLGFIKGDIAVGYYSAAIKVKQILVTLVTSLGAVLMPRLSFYHEQGRLDEFKNLVGRALQFVFVISIPLMLFFMIMAKDSIVFLSGENFIPSVLPMQLIMPTILFIGISNVTGFQVLVPTNREKLVIFSTIIGAIIDILINVFAIPMFSASGAAIAGSVAEFAVTMVQIYFLRDLIIPLLKSISYWKLGIAALLATVFTVLIKQGVAFNAFVNLVISGLVFFVTYGLTVLFLKEEFTESIFGSLMKKFIKG